MYHITHNSLGSCIVEEFHPYQHIYFTLYPHGDSAESSEHLLCQHNKEHIQVNRKQTKAPQTQRLSNCHLTEPFKHVYCTDYRLACKAQQIYKLQVPGIGYEDLEYTVAVTGVAEVLESEVALAFRELVAEGLLELGAAGSHDHPPVPPPGGGSGEVPETRPEPGAAPLGRRGGQGGSRWCAHREFVEVSSGFSNHCMDKSSYLKNRCPICRRGWSKRRRDGVERGRRWRRRA